MYDLTIHQDLVHEFDNEHPFLEQIALINNCIEEIQPTRIRYQGYRNPNKHQNEAIWDDFRTVTLDPATLPSVTLASGTYLQVPSRYAKTRDTISVYSKNLLLKRKEDNDNSDARFATFTQEQLEAKRSAQRMNRGRDRQKAGQAYLGQENSMPARPNTWTSAGMEGSRRGASGGYRGYQQPNLAMPSHIQGPSVVNYDGRHKQPRQHASQMSRAQNASRQSQHLEPRGKYDNNSDAQLNRSSAQTLRQEKFVNYNSHRDYPVLHDQQATFAAPMPSFPQPIGRVMPVTGVNQQVGYLVPPPFVPPNQWPGYNYVTPLTGENMQQLGYSFIPNQTYLGTAQQHSQYSMQDNTQEQIPRHPVQTNLTQDAARHSAAVHEYGSSATVQDKILRRPVQTDLNNDISRRSAAVHESNEPSNVQEQILRCPAETHLSRDAIRSSAAVHESNNSANIQDQLLRRPVRTNLGQSTTRYSETSNMTAGHNYSTTYGTSQVHQFAPAPSYANTLPQQYEPHHPDYTRVDREYEDWLDEENPLSNCFRGPQIEREAIPRQRRAPIDPEIEGIIRRMEEIDTHREYVSLVGQGIAANKLTTAQVAQALHNDSSREYLGYTVSGQRPSEVSRDPSPAISRPAGGRRRYESRRSTPAGHHHAGLESRRSSPGPQGSVKYNKHFAYKGRSWNEEN